MKTIEEAHSRSPGGSGRFFPGVDLPTASGDVFSIEALRPQWDLVVVMLGEEPVRRDAPASANAIRLLDLLSEGRNEFETEGAKVFAVANAEPTSSSKWEWPMPLLFDVNGALHASAGAVDDAGRPTLTLVVTDRYREIFAKLQPSHSGFPKTLGDVLDWVTFVNIQCPECGAPE